MPQPCTVPEAEATRLSIAPLALLLPLYPQDKRRHALWAHQPPGPVYQELANQLSLWYAQYRAS
jgi:hypothetical protein